MTPWVAFCDSLVTMEMEACDDGRIIFHAEKDQLPKNGHSHAAHASILRSACWTSASVLFGFLFPMSRAQTTFKVSVFNMASIDRKENYDHRICTWFWSLKYSKPNMRSPPYMCWSNPCHRDSQVQTADNDPEIRASWSTAEIKGWSSWSSRSCQLVDVTS